MNLRCFGDEHLSINSLSRKGVSAKPSTLQITVTINSIPSNQDQEALESALDILSYYEEDEYECLADESVISDLIENFGFNIVDAHVLLEVAQMKHQERLDSGY